MNDRHLIATNTKNLGLGNRVRFTLSCAAIAQAERRDFFYHWPTGPEFGAKFTDLWDFEGVTLEKPGPEPYLTQWSTAMVDIEPYRNDRVISLIGSQVVKGFGNEESWESIFQKLTPVSNISSMADLILRQIGGVFIGVQVRVSQNSHEKTLASSPVDWFIGRMRKFSEENPGVKFSLSCDDVNAQSMIVHSIPNVIAQNKSGGFNTKESIIEAVVDLIVLSKSKYLLGPSFSSFVHLARVLGAYSQPFETSQGGVVWV